MANNDTQKFAFLRGWKKIPNGQTNAIRDEICATLGGVTLPTFYARLKGIPEPKISEYQAIEEVFARHGITDIWGE